MSKKSMGLVLIRMKTRTNFFDILIYLFVYVFKSRYE